MLSIASRAAQPPNAIVLSEFFADESSMEETLETHLSFNGEIFFQMMFAFLHQILFSPLIDAFEGEMGKFSNFDNCFFSNNRTWWSGTKLWPML